METGAADGIIAEALAQYDIGEWDDALQSLVRANRTTPDPALEVALADLRHRCWMQVSDLPDAPRVEPAPSPPVGPSGLPEARSDTLTAAQIRGAVLSHGSLIVRDALDADAVEALRTEIADAIDAAADPTPGSSVWRPMKLLPEVAATMSTPPRPLRRSFVVDAGGTLLADAPRAMFRLLELFDALGLHDLVSQYLGSRPVMSATKSTLRRVPFDAVGGWHQDGAFLGTGVQAINIWITLTDCGTDAPGLDIVPRRLEEVVETGLDGSFFDWDVSDAQVAELTDGAGGLRPQFSAGDMMVFDEMMLHRTATTPSMTRNRDAIEFWCFAPGAYPESQIPVVW